MVQESGWIRGPYLAVLWRSRGRQDLYKVLWDSPETIENADR